MSKRDEINKWLNKELSEEHLIIDSVLDIFDNIMTLFISNGWKLRQDEDTLLMNLINYLYQNSYKDV
jgi:hypothetical protein